MDVAHSMIATLHVPLGALGTARIQLDALLKDGHHLKGPFSMSLGGGEGSIIVGLKAGLATLM